MTELLTFTLFGSVIAFWSVVLLFVVIAFISENYKQGIPMFFITIGLVIAHQYKSNFNVLQYFDLANILIYLGIGFVFSLIRTYFYANRKKRKALKNYHNDENLNKKLEALKEDVKSDLKGNVFRWWFMWPASAIYWLVSDLIRDLWNSFYDKISKLFTGLVNLGFK